MMGDTRAINNGLVDDNFKKVWEIREDLFLGITGRAKYGLVLKDYLVKLSKHNPSVIVSGALKFLLDYPIMDSTFSIAGLYDDERVFGWQFSNKHQEFFKNENGLRLSIASNSNVDKFNTYFIEEFRKSPNIIDTMDKTIEYASLIDDTICNKWHLLQSIEG